MKREFLKKVIASGITMLIMTSIYNVSASAKWVKDSKDGWNWVEDGEKVVGWKDIDGDWYYFNKDGVMCTGWLKDNGVWYNLSSGGQMNIGWKQIDGKSYYFNENGALLNSNSEDSVNHASIGYVVTNSDSLNVRSDATLSADIIGTIDKGAEVKIVDDEKNGFYPIILSGKKGWVSSQWISLKDSDNTSTQPVINQSVVDSDNSDDLEYSPMSNKNSISNESNKQKATNVKFGPIRDTQPSLDNKYYYSDGNLFYRAKLSPPFTNGGKVIKGNCTWYAWGRAWEITGVKPDDAGFIGNAYEWWNANKKSGKYEYGSEPRKGAIAVWKSGLPGSGGSGHVAIVEKIDNGKIYISESTWHGVAFAYRVIYSTEYLYGYIYLDKPNY